MAGVPQDLFNFHGRMTGDLCEVAVMRPMALPQKHEQETGRSYSFL